MKYYLLIGWISTENSVRPVELLRAYQHSRGGGYLVEPSKFFHYSAVESIGSPVAISNLERSSDSGSSGSEW